jgi:hypothetical protein
MRSAKRLVEVFGGSHECRGHVELHDGVHDEERRDLREEDSRKCQVETTLSAHGFVCARSLRGCAAVGMLQ